MWPSIEEFKRNKWICIFWYRKWGLQFIEYFFRLLCVRSKSMLWILLPFFICFLLIHIYHRTFVRFLLTIYKTYKYFIPLFLSLNQPMCVFSLRRRKEIYSGTCFCSRRNEFIFCLFRNSSMFQFPTLPKWRNNKTRWLFLPHLLTIFV